MTTGRGGREKLQVCRHYRHHHSRLENILLCTFLSCLAGKIVTIVIITINTINLIISFYLPKLSGWQCEVQLVRKAVGLVAQLPANAKIFLITIYHTSQNINHHKYPDMDLMFV